MTSPVFGIVNLRPQVDPVSVVGADFSKIGIVTTSDDADAGVIPLNTPLRFNSQDSTFLAALGTGFLADAVRGINDQMGPLQSAADLIVIRVAVGSTLNNTMQNVIDGVTAMKGAPAAVNATPRIIICPGYTQYTTQIVSSATVTSAAKSGGNTGNGVLTLGTPDYLPGVQPGVYRVRFTGGAKSGTSAAKLGGNTGNGTLGSLTVDSSSVNGVWRVVCGLAATNGGTFSVLKPDGTTDGLAIVGTPYNSAAGPNFTLADGSSDFIVGDEFQITVVDSIPANGGTFAVTDPDGGLVNTGVVGTQFSHQVQFTIADGSTDFIIGDGFDLTAVVVASTIGANPVVASLESTLDALLAIAIVDGPDDTALNAENWRETINSERIMCTGVSCTVFEDADEVNRPTAPRIAGLIVRSDNAHGGRPFNPFANQQLYGILGPSRPIPFSMFDGSTEGQVMLSNQLAIIVRGELGVDSAITDAGFDFIGWQSASSNEDVWAQIHEIRGADYITVECAKITRTFLGKMVTADLAEAWLNSLRFMLRDHVHQNDILGFKVTFNPDLNSPTQIRLGHLTVSLAFEPGPAFTVATHNVLRYLPAIDDLVANIVAALGNGQ